MSAIEVGRRRREAFARRARGAGVGPNRAGRTGAALLAVAILVAATSVAARAADDRQDCAASASTFDQKLAACTRVIADDSQTPTNRAEAFNSRGVAYFGKSDFDHAISDYGEALKLDSVHAGALKNRGLAYAKKGDQDRAIADFSAAIDLDAGQVEARYGRGLAYAAKKDNERAIADFSEVINLDREHIEAFDSRALAYLRSGDYDRAIADYSESIKINANYPAAYNGRGFAHFKKKDYDLALADYNEAIRRNASYSRALDNRGLVHEAKGDFDHALADYDEAIKHDPKLASAYAHRGALNSIKGDYDRSIADLTQAITRDAGMAFAYRTRCNANYAKRAYDAAIADCGDAIRLEPADDFAVATRGLAYAAKRDFDAALADANEAIRLNPKSGLGYGSRASVYRIKRDYNAAIADYSEAISLNPKFAAAYSNRGSTYQEKGDSERAIADFGRAIEANPRFFQAYNLRGKALAARGENISAVADFNNAIRLNPTLVEAYDNRAIAYMALHRTEEAIADFRKAQSIDPADKTSKEKLASIAPANVADPAILGKAMSRMSIDLPIGIAAVDPVRKPLDDLSREPCDRDAIAALAHALEGIGRKRDAASAQSSFSGACGGHAPSLKAAANILLALSDFEGAAAVASDLIKLDPHDDGGYYLRALAYDRGGSAKKAIDDYVTAIGLFANKANIGNESYLAIARNYEKLGQFCDAAFSIEAWIALNPERNDSSRMQAIIADDIAKGRCETPNSRSEEIFKLTPQKNVVKLPVIVNGVRGTFIMDTGATLVTLSAAFAQKAKVEVDQGSTVKMHTANGIVEGKRGHAATVQVRSLQAKEVVVVVQAGSQVSYGDGVDGLLGMSFLSRFRVSIDTESVRISNRNAK